MRSSARTAAAVTARSLDWLGRHRGNSLIRNSAAPTYINSSTMRRFQKNFANAAAEDGNKQVPKSTMDSGGETGGKKNQENAGNKANAAVPVLRIPGTLVYTSKKSTKQVIHLMKMYGTHESADAKLKRIVETFKEKIGGKFKEKTGSIIPSLQNGEQEYLNETCVGMDDTIKELQAGRRVCTCIEGDDGVGKTTTLKRGLQGLNNVLYITMNHRKDSAESLMCTKLGAESGDSWPFDWRNVLVVSATEVRDAGQPPIIVLVDDVDAAFKSNSEEMSLILAFLMHCVDESLISLVILGNEPIQPFVDKAKISSRDRLKYVKVRPNPKLIDELAERLNWGEKLSEPLCGAVTILFGPHLISLRAVSELTIGFDDEVKKDPTKQNQAKAQLQENVKLAVVDVLKGHSTMLASPVKRLRNELEYGERALLIKMLESAGDVFIVDAYDDIYETACKPLCDADSVRRELNGVKIVYRFTHVGVEVMARVWAKNLRLITRCTWQSTAGLPALTSERAKKQFDALEVVGFK